MFREMRNVAESGFKYGWRNRTVRLLVLHSFFVWGFFYWAWYAWPPYFLDLFGREDAVWLAGVVAAQFSLAQLAGNAVAGRVARVGRRRTTILLVSCALLSLLMTATGVVQFFWVTVPLFLLGAIAAGVMQPLHQAYLHSSIPTTERATLVSFNSLLANLGSIGGSTGLGYVSQVRSVPAGFIVGGLATFVAIPLLVRLRHLGERGDRIEESAGGLAKAGA